MLKSTVIAAAICAASSLAYAAGQHKAAEPRVIRQEKEKQTVSREIQTEPFEVEQKISSDAKSSDIPASVSVAAPDITHTTPSEMTPVKLVETTASTPVRAVRTGSAPPPPPMPSSLMVTPVRTPIAASPARRGGPPPPPGTPGVSTPVQRTATAPPPPPLPPAVVENTASPRLQAAVANARAHNPPPQVPMKALFWAPASGSKGVDTVWERVSHTETPVEFDLSQLHEHFSQTKAAQSAERKSLGKPQKSLLQPQKKMQLGIVLQGKMKGVSCDLFRAAVYGDDSMLEQQTLTELFHVVPSADEQDVILQYDVDYPAMSLEERFYLEMLEVPRLQNKLAGMIFQRTFQKTADDCSESLSVVSDASAQLVQSEEFARLLRVVLALGNYMNGGTARGASRAFHIDSLLKLDDMRSTRKPSVTLLQYVCQHLRKTDPGVLQLPKLLVKMAPASKIALDILRAELRETNTSLRALKSEIDLCGNEEEEPFATKFQPVYETAMSRIEKLNEQMTSTQTAFQRVVEYLGVNPVDATPATVFGTVQRFLQQMEKYC